MKTTSSFIDFRHIYPSHKLQPCDIGIFGPLKIAYRVEAMNSSTSVILSLPMSIALHNIVVWCTVAPLCENKVTPVFGSEGGLKNYPDTFHLSESRSGTTTTILIDGFLAPSH